MRNFVSSAMAAGVFLTVGCGGGGVTGTASLLNGPTPATREKAAYRPEIRPSDGNWNISPDKMKVTLQQVSFYTQGTSGDGKTAELSNCIIEYDRSKAGLAKLVDCPFEMDEGTFRGVGATFSATYEVLVDDTVNNIYSDPNAPSKFTTTRPSGGGQYVSVTTSSSGSTFGNNSALSAPLTTTAGQTVSLSIVINGLQFLKLNISGGTISVGWTTGYTNDPFRPDMTASVTSVARLGHYVHTSVGDALSYNFNTASSLMGSVGIISASVFYSSDTTPTTLFIGLNGSPACGSLEVSGATNTKADSMGYGGYLGLDPSGVLGWALPGDDDWTSYIALLSMPQKSTLGETTTLSCKSTSTDPDPPGGTFSSAAPNTSGAETSVPLELVAK